MPDFLVVPHAPATSAHPGGCYLCKCDQRQDPNTGELEPMIDTFIELDLTNAADDLASVQRRQSLGGTSLVICRGCVLEMAVAFDCATPEQAEALRDQAATAEAAREQAADDLEAAQIWNRAALESTAAVFGPSPEPAAKK